jgi:hypothetical protein
MRSDLVFGATNRIPNRFLLVRALAKAARGLHKPGTRIQDTTNDVLVRFTEANQIAPHDAVSVAAEVPSQSKKAQTAKPGSSKHAKVSLIRQAPQPQPEAFKAPEHRKRA